MFGRKRQPAKTVDEQPDALAQVPEEPAAFPGPSPNPATNLLIADVMLRGVSALFRRKAEQTMLRARIDPAAAQRALHGRTMGKSLITYAATRIATRSIPGLLVVSGGLAAKTLLDRKLAQRRAERAAADAKVTSGDQGVQQDLPTGPP